MSIERALSCLLAVLAGVTLWVTVDSWGRWLWRVTNSVWTRTVDTHAGVAVACVCTGFGFLALAWLTPGGVGPLATFILEGVFFWLAIRVVADRIPGRRPPETE